MVDEVVELYRLFALVLVVSVASLAVLAMGYWYIMKQDSTVLTTVSASVGALAGYYLKALRDRLKSKG